MKGEIEIGGAVDSWLRMKGEIEIGGALDSWLRMKGEIEIGGAVDSWLRMQVVFSLNPTHALLVITTMYLLQAVHLDTWLALKKMAGWLLLTVLKALVTAEKLCWIVNMTTETQKQGIRNFFTPSSKAIPAIL